MVASAGSCRTWEIEDVGTVALMCLGGLLRIGDESLLLPVLEVGSLAKGSWMLG